jgi:hypothetical protein
MMCFMNIKTLFDFCKEHSLSNDGASPDNVQAAIRARDAVKAGLTDQKHCQYNLALGRELIEIENREGETLEEFLSPK